MRGIAILLGFNLLGLAMNKWLSVPLPPNVIGLILFTLSLFLNIVKLEWVEQSAQFLLKHMMLFFAPIIVGTIVFMDVIGKQWLPIAAGLLGSTFVVLLATGWTTALLTRRSISSGHAEDAGAEDQDTGKPGVKRTEKNGSSGKGKGITVGGGGHDAS